MATAKGEKTREKLVEAAAVLMRRRGFHGTGLGQILAESGAPRGSLYFHFPGGKEQLTCAAIDAAGQRWRAAVEEVLAGAEGLREKVIAVGELLAAELEETGFADGCPVATIALETAAESPEIRERCAAVYDGWLELVEATLAEAGMTGPDARSMAQLALCAFEGGLLIARVQRSGEPVRAVAAMLARLTPG